MSRMARELSDSGNKGNDTMSSNRGLNEMRHPYSHIRALPENSVIIKKL